ncbi:hypothetical protein DFH28DRAFT_1163218 [Melampsora americana]|nr:hypothetical protein DFH28DRAFT_1163218 [Melampsora americana]
MNRLSLRTFHESGESELSSRHQIMRLESKLQSKTEIKSSMGLHPSTRRFTRYFNLIFSKLFNWVKRISPALLNAILAATQRLDLSLNPTKTINKLKSHHWHWKNDAQYLIMISVAGLSLYICGLPWFLKLFIILAYSTALLLPLTFSILLTRLSNLHLDPRFISGCQSYPTLESVLYGANISDILTRYTNPVLDVIAWLPYGVLHFVLPFVTAIFLFVFGGPGAVKFFGKAFGYMNLAGVAVQILFPCAPPWYELKAGGLARIDHLFHSKGYTNTFRNSPIVFGAFPSLHAGCATLEALFLSHYFPRWRVLYWTYAFILYWSTMYLTHHYLIDLVAGGSFAISAFYLFLTEDQRHLPMLNASNAGEEESIAKGYHSGLRGMIGHKGANGSWINLNQQIESSTSGSNQVYQLIDKRTPDDLESGSMFSHSKHHGHENFEEGDLGSFSSSNHLQDQSISMISDYRSPSKSTLTIVQSRATSPVPGSKPLSGLNENEYGNPSADVSLDSLGFHSNSLSAINKPSVGYGVEPITRTKTPKLE